MLNTERKPTGDTLDCGASIPDRIPYYSLLLLMIGTTFYSSRQTQKATPASAQNPQTQIITKVMPVMFGIFGFGFPTGLVLYWTVSNLFQIGQQAVMLRLGAHRAGGDGSPAHPGASEGLDEDRQAERRLHGEDDGAGRAGAEAPSG